MCVEAAVCYALGLPHGDDPGCVAQSIRSLKIQLNDATWSSPEVRARGLRRLGLAQLGSNDAFDEKEFVARVVHVMITKQVPAALRATASTHEDAEHQAALEAAAKRCESEADYASCIDARSAATAACDATRAIVAAKAADAAISAAGSAAAVAPTAADDTDHDDEIDYDDDYDVDDDAADVASKAVNVAAYAAEAAFNAAGGQLDDVGTRDKSLTGFAEDIVQILIAMKAPGCQWLELTEAA
jgi:hypothetical protein